MSRKLLAPTGEAFCQKISKFIPFLGNKGRENVVGLLEELGKTSEGYGEVWRKFVEVLRTAKQQILEGLGKTMPEGDFDDLINRLSEIGPSNARKRMRDLGVIIRPPEERAIPMAYAITRKGPSSILVSNEELRGFLQGIYAVENTAIGTLNKIADILEKGKEEGNEEINFLVKRLRVLAKHVGFKILRRYGVVLDSWEDVIKKTQFRPGDRENGIRAKRIHLQQRARLSPLAREKKRIQEAKEKELPHQGRRKGIFEKETGHHPYLLGIYEANLARRLTREGKEWLYRPHATVIEIPPNESRRVGGKRVLLFEPAFYVPQDEEYFVVVQDGRERQNRAKKRGEGEEMEESQREAEIAFIQEQMPKYKITAVHSSGKDIAYGVERVGKVRVINERVSVGRKSEFKKTRKTIPGPNITTDPDRFLMSVDECPCAQCGLNYRNTRPVEFPQEFPRYRRGSRSR